MWSRARTGPLLTVHLLSLLNQRNYRAADKSGTLSNVHADGIASIIRKHLKLSSVSNKE